MPYLYRHIRLDKNEPFYIGIGGDKNFKRAYEKRGRSKFWHKLVNKSAYEVEILLYDLTKEDVKVKEKEFIALYGRKDKNAGPLVNMTDGGDGLINLIFSDEHKKKLSITAKARGVPPSTFNKMMEARRAHIWTDEQKKILSASRMGMKQSEQHRINGSLAKMGKRNPAFGLSGSKSKSTKHIFYAIRDGERIGPFYGMYDCGEKLGISASAINRVIKGQRTHVHGFKFEPKVL